MSIGDVTFPLPFIDPKKKEKNGVPLREPR